MGVVFGCLTDKLPNVVIITPSFNQENFIEDTLLSIKRQDYPCIEHIIIDGGSTDNSVEIIRKYENAYNMRWISEPDNGQSDAINKGFKLADGLIIGWLNSDDVYFSSSTISYVVHKFLEHKTASVIFGDDILIDSDSSFLFKRTMNEFDLKKMLVGNIISQPATFFSKEVIDNELLDESLNYAMDYEYWLRLYSKGYKFKYVNNILACNRIHKNRKMVVGKTEADEEVRRIKENFSTVVDPTDGFINKFIGKMSYYTNRLMGVNSLIQLSYKGDKITGMKPNRLPKLILEQLFMTSYKKIVKA